MVIETHGLTKEYRRTLAVENLNLAIPDGSISAFLGPNGSGKTTTIKMLLGLARPTAGNALVFGQPACDDIASVAIRRRTGYVGEDKRLYGYMTVRQISELCPIRVSDVGCRSRAGACETVRSATRPQM